MIGLELLGGLEQRSGGAARADLLIAGEIERSAGSDPPICTAPAMVASARNTCVGSRAAIRRRSCSFLEKIQFFSRFKNNYVYTVKGF